MALARAMVNEPDLVLADEPTSQVDAESAANDPLRVGSHGRPGQDGRHHDPRSHARRALSAAVSHGGGRLEQHRMIVNKYSVLMLFMAGAGTRPGRRVGGDGPVGGVADSCAAGENRMPAGRSEAYTWPPWSPSFAWRFW